MELKDLTKLGLEADEREEPTEEEIKNWWDNDNNLSEKQHAVDPNRLWDQESLEFCKKPYDQHDGEGKMVIWIAYSFRHQEKALTSFLGYDIHENSRSWWNTYNSSQHYHMFDPHQIFPNSADFASKLYDDMDENEKEEVDKLYDKKHSETSSAKTHEDVKESLLKTTKLGLEGGFGSGRRGHAPWMKPITQKTKSPETRDDIPIEKINEAILKDPLYEGLLSDYFLNKNGQSYSYCPYCNARTKHLNGACTNCPPQRLIDQDVPRKQPNTRPKYDITNIEPDTDPDDASESLKKVTKLGL